jgi:hypothetical protein
MEKITYTFEMIKAILAETDQIVKENSLQLKELKERQAETDRILTEKQAKTDRLINKLTANVKKRSEEAENSQAETWRQINELTESRKENEKLMADNWLQINKLTENVNNLNIDVGGVQNSNGDFAEEYFFNSFKRGERTYFGETFDEIKKNVPGGKPRTEFHDEYDIVLYNCKTIGIIEVKFKARKFHVDDTIDKVKTFRANFPKYVNHQFYLALAAMAFEKGVEKKCKDKGIAIIKQEGDMVMICDNKLIAY